MDKKAEEELIKLQEANGLLNPKDVVNFARSKKTALHKHFEWDDSLAAEAHRVYQARGLIRLVLVVLPSSKKNREIETRRFVSLMPDRKRDEGNSVGYRAVVEVLSDEDLRAQLLSQAMQELEIFRVKYAVLFELGKVFSAIEEMSTVGGQYTLPPVVMSRPEQRV